MLPFAPLSISETSLLMSDDDMLHVACILAFLDLDVDSRLLISAGDIVKDFISSRWVPGSYSSLPLCNCP